MVGRALAFRHHRLFLRPHPETRCSLGSLPIVDLGRFHLARDHATAGDRRQRV